MIGAYNAQSGGEWHNNRAGEPVPRHLRYTLVPIAKIWSGHFNVLFDFKFFMFESINKYNIHANNCIIFVYSLLVKLADSHSKTKTIKSYKYIYIYIFAFLSQQ